MTAPLRQHEPASKRRAKKPAERVVLLDQENATEVWRTLDRFDPRPQTQIAEAVGISQSAISEWRTGKRTVTFERIPALAEFYGVPQMVFLSPAKDVEKALAPAFKTLDAARSEALRIAQAALRDMDRYRDKPVQGRFFDEAPTGRHLQPVQ